MSNFFISTPVTGKDNFSYRNISPGVTLSIPAEQQMITYQEIQIQDTGELDLEGELVLFN